jgi:chromosome partitioning protein
MSASAIVVLNLKGGVGKTSTCFHLAGSFSKLSHRVLLIDCDPQANLSEGFLAPDEIDGLPAGKTIVALFNDSVLLDYRSLIRPTSFEHIHLLPGSHDLADYNEPKPANHRNRRVLREFVDEVRQDYDIILLDCPPSLALTSWTALVAADGCVVPVQPEDFGMQGLRQLNTEFKRVKAEANRSLALLGYLVTHYNARMSVHEMYLEQLRNSYADKVFHTTIPYVADYKLSVTSKQPIGLLKPRSVAAKAMNALAQELLVRLEATGIRKAVA